MHRRYVALRTYNTSVLLPRDFSSFAHPIYDALERKPLNGFSNIEFEEGKPDEADSDRGSMASSATSLPESTPREAVRLKSVDLAWFGHEWALKDGKSEDEAVDHDYGPDRSTSRLHASTDT